MIEGKQYLLSFTTLFLTKKGYVLYFNRHKNVLNINQFPQQFNPWNRYDALVLSDSKQGTKVKQATSVYTKEVDFNTVLEGDNLDDIVESGSVYLANISEGLNKLMLKQKEGALPNKLNSADFYNLLGVVLEDVNSKLVRDATTTDYQKAIVKNELYADTQTLEAAGNMLKDAELTSSDRMLAIQYGEKALGMAKASFANILVTNYLNKVSDAINYKKEIETLYLDGANSLVRYGDLDETANSYKPVWLQGDVVGLVGEGQRGQSVVIKFSDYVEQEGAANIKAADIGYQTIADKDEDIVYGETSKLEDFVSYVIQFGAIDVGETASEVFILGELDQVVNSNVEEKTVYGVSADSKIEARKVHQADITTLVEGDQTKQGEIEELESTGYITLNGDAVSTLQEMIRSNIPQGDVVALDKGVSIKEASNDVRVFEEGVNFTEADQDTMTFTVNVSGGDLDAQSQAITVKVGEVDQVTGVIPNIQGRIENLEVSHKEGLYGTVEDLLNGIKDDVVYGETNLIEDSSLIYKGALLVEADQSFKVDVLEGDEVSQILTTVVKILNADIGHSADAKIVSHLDLYSTAPEKAELSREGNLSEDMTTGSEFKVISLLEVQGGDQAPIYGKDSESFTGAGSNTYGTISSIDYNASPSGTTETEVVNWTVMDVTERVMDVTVEQQTPSDIRDAVEDVDLATYDHMTFIDRVYDTAIAPQVVGTFLDTVMDIQHDSGETGSIAETIYDFEEVEINTAKVPEQTMESTIGDYAAAYVDAPLLTVTIEDSSLGKLPDTVTDTHISEHTSAERLDVTYDVEVNLAELGSRGEDEVSVEVVSVIRGLGNTQELDIVIHGTESAGMDQLDYEVVVEVPTSAKVGDDAKEVTILPTEVGGYSGLDVYVVLDTVEESTSNEIIRDTQLTGTDNASTDLVVDVALNQGDRGESANEQEVTLNGMDTSIPSQSITDVLVERTDQAEGSQFSEVTIERPELFGDSVSDVEVELNTVNTGTNQQSSEVEINEHDFAMPSEHYRDVELNWTDKATTEQGNHEVELNTPTLAENSKLGIDIELSTQDSAITSVDQIDVVVEVLDQANIVETFTDVVEEPFEGATRGRGRVIGIDSDETSDKVSGQGIISINSDDLAERHNGYGITIETEDLAGRGDSGPEISIEGAEESERRGHKLVTIYEDEGATPKGLTIISIAEDEVVTRGGSAVISVEVEETVERTTSKVVTIEEGSAGTRDKVSNMDIHGDSSSVRNKEFDISLEVGDEGIREREFEGTLDTEDDDLGVGLIPTPPPWEEPPEKKGKIWLVMGKQYPAWNNWNPKKTR